MIVQVETAQALAAIAAIGAVDGVDGIFIGPSDLSADMGYLGRAWAPEMRPIIADGMQRIHASGKAAGTLNFDPADANALFGSGFDFIAVGSDSSLLLRGSDRLRSEFSSLARN